MLLLTPQLTSNSSYFPDDQKFQETFSGNCPENIAPLTGCCFLVE